MYIEEKIKGTLYMPDGTDFEFTESDVINNSVSISSQCMPDTSFVLGGVYSAQLDITLRISSENANAYNVLGSKIKIYTKYDNEDDYVLRGVFWITSTSRYRDIYTLSGSDMITWLNAGTYNSSQDVQNYVYHYLRSQDSDTLSTCMGNITEAINSVLQNSNIERLFFEWNHNHTINNNPCEDDGSFPGFNLPDPARTGENETKTPREYTSWISTVACGFIDMTYTPKDNGNPMIYDGQLVDCAIKISQFESEPSAEIPYYCIENDSLDIAEFTISKFKIFFGLNYLEKNNSEKWGYGAVSKGSGNSEIIVDVSENPFVQAYFFNNDKTGDNYNCMKILNGICDNLASLTIRPFQLKCHVKERFKLGQCIQIEDEKGIKHKSLITKMNWTFRGGYELGCAGEDNRILYDTVRRTPAVKAKEQAVTKLNYEKSKLQNQINDMCDENRIGSLQYQINETEQIASGQSDNLQNQINDMNDEYVENSLYWHICRLRERIESLEEWRNSIDTQSQL